MGGAGMEEIRESVGDGGANRTADVLVVQRLLLASGVQVRISGPLLDTTLPLVVDGRGGQATIAHIEEFQRRTLHMRAGDPQFGLVIPDGATIFALNGLSGGRQPARRQQPVRRAYEHKAPGVRRLVYERREVASESGANPGPFSALAGVLTGRLRGAGRALESRHQNYPQPYRVTAVRIRETVHRSTNIGSTLTQTSTELWLTWGHPGSTITVTEERVQTGTSGPDSSNRRTIPRAQLDQILPRGQ